MSWNGAKIINQEGYQPVYRDINSIRFIDRCECGSGCVGSILLYSQEKGETIQGNINITDSNCIGIDSHDPKLSDEFKLFWGVMIEFFKILGRIIKSKWQRQVDRFRRTIK